MVEQRMRTSGSSLAWPPRGDASSLNSVPPSWLKIGGSREAHSNGGTDSYSVLFVCTGNICRSAFAAAYLGHLIRGSGITVESAGIGAVVGHGMDERAVHFARRLGVDGSVHRARQLTGRMLRKASQVLVFGEDHSIWIHENYPDANPKVAGLGVVERMVNGKSVRTYLDLKTLFSAIGLGHSNYEQADWISDPYGKPDAVYFSVMNRIRCDVEMLHQCLRQRL